MGIKFLCPNGHKLNVKSFLAGKKGVCPECQQRFVIPLESTPKQRVESIGISTAGAGSDEELAQDSPDEPIEIGNPAAYSQAAHGQSIPVGTSVGMSGGGAVVADAHESMRGGGASHANPVTPPMPSVSPAPFVDPLDEAPNAQWYVRPPTGGQFGPARSDLLRRWIGEGRVSADSLVWREGWTDWKPAGGMLPGVGGTQPQMLAPAPSAPAPVRPAGPAQMVGTPHTTTSTGAPSFLSGGNFGGGLPAMAGAAASPSRAATLSPRRSSNMLPVVIGLTVVAVLMLVVLIWVVMSN